MVILAPSPTALQSLLDICNEYAEEFEILYNAKKTKCMCFKSKLMKDIRVPSFQLKEQNIANVTVQKYLGVFISEDSKDDLDIERQMKSVYARGNSLIRKFKACCVDVKAKLFKAFCSNMYGCPLWCKFNKASMTKLDISYKRVYKHLLSLRKESITRKMLEYRCDPMKVLLRKLVNSFRVRVFSSNNVIIRAIAGSTFNVSCILTRQWNDSCFSLQSS